MGVELLKKKLTREGNVEYVDEDREREANLILGYLQDFGLTEKEAKVFFILSKTGSATAPEVANIAELNRLQSYRAIRGLLDRGLVEMSLDRPRRFTPLKIEQALNLLRQEAERKILEFEKKSPILMREWAASSDLQLDKAKYSFRIIQGYKNVAKFKIMLCETAKKEIAAALKPNELTNLMIDGTDDVLEGLASNNVSVRGLSEVNEFNLDASKRFLEFSRLNHTTRSNMVPFIIIDGQEALVCLSRDGNGGVSENAIWTNHPEMVRILAEVYETLWRESQNGKTRVIELEKNRS